MAKNNGKSKDTELDGHLREAETAGKEFGAQMFSEAESALREVHNENVDLRARLVAAEERLEKYKSLPPMLSETFKKAALGEFHTRLTRLRQQLNRPGTTTKPATGPNTTI